MKLNAQASYAVRRWRLCLVGLTLMVAIESRADIVNIAAVSYTNALGTPFSGVSNSVSVVFDLKLPPIFLGGIDGKSFFINSQIGLDYFYAGPATYTWSLEPQTVGARAAMGIPLNESAVPVIPLGTTAQPQIHLSGQNLIPGAYRLTVTVSAGQQSQSASASIALVASNMQSLKVYPNPWRSDRHIGDLTFAGLSAGVTIRIFTVSGQWVRTLPPADGQQTWDLRNEAGQNVASGIYLYVAEDRDGNQTRGKFAVIR